jgi:hypothetical protein
MSTNEEVKKNREVNVDIKAKQLFELGEFVTQAQIDNHTGFASNEVVDGHFVNEVWKSHKDYELTVYKNHTMLWFIPSGNDKGENSGYETKLLDVSHNPKSGSPNIFDSDILNAGSDGMIRATISNNAEMSQDYIYTVNFSITNNGVTRTYSIDPKLKINS